MLTQRLEQLGVKTNLSEITEGDVTAMAQQAELAKVRVQNAKTYVRAAKSMLGSVAKAAKVESDFYKDADAKIREADKHRLATHQTKLRHMVHVARANAQREGMDQLAEHEGGLAVQLEQAKTQRKMIEVGMRYRLPEPKRQGLLGFFRNGKSR